MSLWLEPTHPSRTHPTKDHEQHEAVVNILSQEPIPGKAYRDTLSENPGGWYASPLGCHVPLRDDQRPTRPGPQGCNAGITPGYRHPPTGDDRLAAVEAEKASLRETVARVEDDVDRLARALAVLAAGVEVSA